MTELVVVTFDWVPDLPRGYVRDIRARWALEEAGLPYRVESVSFHDRGAAHFDQQPFGQVPWLRDGELSIFESGAILLHLGEISPKLMPTDVKGRSEVVQWLFAALNSVEVPSIPWSLYQFTGDTTQSPGRQQLDGFLRVRLDRMETVLAEREWLTQAFSIADIAMADALRLIDRFDGLAQHPACRAYKVRATSRPAFEKAYADQMGHVAAADPRT